MPSYAKFLKDIISNKRKLEESVVETLNGQCSDILGCKVPKKQADPGSFTIPLKFGKDVSAVALADLGASVSVMPLTLCKKINGEMKVTRMSIQLVDRSVRYPVAILEDFPVQVGNYFVPCDFVIMDMEEDTRIPVILGRDFLKTTAAIFDVKNGKLSLEILGEQLHFHLSSSMAHPAIEETVYRVDAIVDATIERESTPSIVDPLYAAIEGNYEKDRVDVIDMVKVLDVAPTFVPTKAKFKDTPPWKVFTIEERKECATPPRVELKPLPPSLKYVFLEDNDTYPVIVNAELNGTQIERLLTVLKKNKSVIGYTIDDIKGSFMIDCVMFMLKVCAVAGKESSLPILKSILKEKDSKVKVKIFRILFALERSFCPSKHMSVRVGRKTLLGNGSSHFYYFGV
ncbi:uncharacterized protein LOC130805717 [Amaranthus tricolor]|uniref:uncharacterized protein LOC130805717 n=1 Tax=Amaranthus tricolor TaxID=29722 RepID=UPI0025868CB9|nr:uncharacterized protein LOC130805717 [Amaranthus tricolor]